MRQQPPGSPTSPFGIAARVSPNTPSLPDIRKRRSSTRRASRPAACLQPLSRSSPDGSQEGPVPYFQRYSSGPEASASEKKKKLRHLLSPAFPLPPFPGPMTRHVLSSQPPANDGDRRPDLRKVFSGMGRAREGKGQFLQKTSLPLSSPALPHTGSHASKTAAAPKGRRDEGMTRGTPHPDGGHGRPACYSISSVRIMWRAAAVSSRRRTGIFTGASSSCWGSDLPRATISRRASM